MKRPLVWTFCASLFGLLAVFSLAQNPADGPHPVTTDAPVALFNGKDLTGWDGDSSLWSVQDGVLTGQTSEANPLTYNKFLIWKDGELDDFELTLDYKIESGNSGVQVRSIRNAGKDFSVSGYQADLDFERGWAGTNYGEGFGGVLAKRGEKAVVKGKDDRTVEPLGDPAQLQALIKVGDWNTYQIVAKGRTITQSINGTPMSEVTDLRPEARLSGILALQLHQGKPMKVQFRNIMLKRLKLADNRKKVVFVAGQPSHGAGQHEHNAGCLLLARLINQYYGDKIQATVYHNGWPADTTAIQNADAVVMYSDGGSRHVGFWHRRQLNELRDRGVGFGAIHYAVEMNPDETNADLISWIGGAFETNYSVNPHWDANFATLPAHPAAKGVKPFTLRDEWYFNMRFADKGKVTPIFSAIPTDDTMSRPDGHHSGNPTVRKMVADKIPQHVMWTYDRPDGGRGFGFTGGHFHQNWQNDNFRKAVLNAVVWISGLDVPEGGVQTPTPTDEEMALNLDPKTPKPAAPKPAATPAPAPSPTPAPPKP